MLIEFRLYFIRRLQLKVALLPYLILLESFNEVDQLGVTCRIKFNQIVNLRQSIRF